MCTNFSISLPILRAILTDPLAADRSAPGLGTFHEVFRAGERNICPGCGGTHWHVGRTMAECPKCETALPILSALAELSAPSRGRVQPPETTPIDARQFIGSKVVTGRPAHRFARDQKR